MKYKFDRVYIELSNICNFECPFCSNVSRKEREMTIAEFENIIGQVQYFTSEICLHVLGEPLLYGQFERVLELCKLSGVKINLVTNGYYIASKLQVILKYATSFKKISFSLHSYVYRKEVMYEKLADILFAATYISNVGVSVELRNLMSNNDSDFVETFSKTVNLYSNVKLKDIGQNQKIKDKMYYVVKKPFVWPNQSKNAKQIISKDKIYCLGGKTHIAILSDLTVVPCCLDSAGEISLGNLYNLTLSEVLNTTYFTNFCASMENGKPPHVLCSTCRYSEK